LEIADENHLKLKIALYYLCLSKPIRHLKDLPVHEAEYDMIEKVMAQKEREDREIRNQQSMKEVKNSSMRERAKKRQNKDEDDRGELGKSISRQDISKDSNIWF
jgi:hypothetical protein